MTKKCLRVLCGVAALQAGVLSQAGWMHVAATGPSARSVAAMAYDGQRGLAVLHGGTDVSGANLGDTWTWNGQVWAQVVSSGPPARSGHSMAFDGTRGCVVLFGGWHNSGYFGDTWEWNGTTWTQMASSGPSARAASAMTFDSLRGRTVLFGGYDTASLGDTWEWSGAGWLPQLFASGPSPRRAHAMAYDVHRGRTVLFGGISGTAALSYLGDTWEWNGTNWGLLASSGPSARHSHVLAYEDHSEKCLLFAGRDTAGYLRDTWEWNGVTWAQCAGSGPAPRQNCVASYDNQRGRTVLFGGSGAGGYRNDTWEWTGTGSAIAYGSGCGSPALSLSPAPLAPPIINTTAEAVLTNSPSTLAFVAVGWSRTQFGAFALPLPLGGYGMPGCSLLQSAELAAQPVMFNGAGGATFSVPLPNWIGLVGLHLHLQGWAVAPGVNPGNTIVSNGLDWFLGF